MHQNSTIMITDIRGAQVLKLDEFEDERGRFKELFRKEWFPQRTWDRVQQNRSDSKAGVLRGLHYHHRQVDYWYVPNGRLRAMLVDIRQDSPTYKQTFAVELGGENDWGLYIPVGVAHGFYALTDVTLLYTVDNYFDGGSDEYGMAWNDPQFELDWGASQPMLSERDRMNPQFKDIPVAELPQYDPTAEG